MTTWQSTQTRGFIKAVFLILMTSAITMGSSIASPTPLQESRTSEESISCRRENREEAKERLRRSQTGNDTLEALRNLNRILNALVEVLSEEK